MNYSVEKYHDDGSVWEVLEDDIPVFWGTEDECNNYVASI